MTAEAQSRVYDGLLALVTPHGQEHLLAFWHELDEPARESLAAELRQIDYARVRKLFRRGDPGEASPRERLQLRGSPDAYCLGRAGGGFSPEQASQRGLAALEAGQVGVLVVAGGQGTRLGFDQPKGMYPIGPLSGRSLFEIHTEKIVALARRSKARIPLYVMTSAATHEQTVQYFAEHRRFGLPADDVFFFCQGAMPAVDRASGKILLAERGRVALSPDGHGGMLDAFGQSGALGHAADRGLRHLFYLQVDNPLVDICGPEFLGYHLLSGSEMTTQVVRKRDPREKVGNVVRQGDGLRVVEYIDLPDDAALQRKPDGSLEIWAGSIGVHAMALAFLERMAASPEALPFHLACKKVPHVDSEGRQVTPEAPNALKFERFIFDLLPKARNPVLVEVDRQHHFAPLKNASGEKEDTPETVRLAMIALHTQWLRQAGAEVAEGVPVEISPLFALDAEELAERMAPGTRVTEPTYFR
jgi:UDP-N-acetylglucosamine/UDP-N-acetylgalactosamine diphosphorylase